MAFRRPFRTFHLLMMALVVIPLASTQAEENFPAISAPEWDRVFQRTDGWTGGDAIYSVDLTQGDVLWLFADSWVGPVREGRHAAGSRLVNNALARHPLLPGGRPVEPSNVQFLWGPHDDEGFPTAWIRPPENDHWYWVADGIVLEEPQKSLAIFLWKIRRTKGEGVFSFASSGGAIAMISNPSADWSEWKIEQFQNPHVRTSREDASPKETLDVIWGSEVLYVADNDGKWLYIYGTRAAKLGKGLLLARVPVDQLTSFERWEFRTKEGWSRTVDDALALATGITSEFSITPLETSAGRRWVLVQSEDFLGPRILTRVAANPWGPWTAGQPIYKVKLGTSKEFSYAAKAHPELSAPGELLISYVINSLDFPAMIANADVYRPRFLRLPIARLSLE